MIRYIDRAILNIDCIQFERNPIFEVPNGIEEYREFGNPFLYNGKAVWTVTAVKIVDGEKVYSIHLYIDWKFIKELKLVGAKGVPRMAEDSYLYLDTSENNWHLHTEDKTSEDEDKLFKLNHFVADKLEGPYYFLGGSSQLSAFGDGYGKSGIYSPCVKNNGAFQYFGAREKKGEAPSPEVVGYADWIKDRFIPLDKPVLHWKDLDDVQSVDVDDIFRVGNEYAIELAMLRGWPDNDYWCNGIAKGTSLKGGWEIINYELKDKQGKRVFVRFFYQDGWKVIGTYWKGRELYLGKIVEKGSSTPPPPPPDKFDKQKTLDTLSRAHTDIRIAIEEIQKI